MTRKQFLAIVGVLVVLLAAGAWVKWSERAVWQATDARVGTPLLPTLNWPSDLSV